MENADAYDPGLRRRRGRFPRSHPVRGRAVFVPLLVAAIQVIGSTIAAIHQSDALPLNGVAYGLLLAGPAALIVRRRHPVAVLVTTLAITAAYLSIDFPRGPFFLAAFVAVFSAAQRVRRELVWSVAAAAYGCYVILTSVAESIGGLRLASPSLTAYIVVAAGTAVTVALAEAGRIRGEHYRELGRAHAAAEHARQEQSRRQASDERLRIARELHDVLGHHLSLINVRAGVALHLLDSRPAEVRDALDAIKLASAEALREVRGVLATLYPVDETAPRSPAHGLADLDDLIAQARAAELPVEVIRDGAARVLPAEVDRAAYRIVQEALTNVRRHAGPGAAATVGVHYGSSSLTVAVSDTGRGPAQSTSDTAMAGASTSDGEGNGIPGMRERAAALGGTLFTGPGPAGGFRVEATLPTPADPVTPTQPLTPTDLSTPTEPLTPTETEEAT